VWVAGRLVVNRWVDRYEQAREEVRVRVRESVVLERERGLPSLHNINYEGILESDPVRNYMEGERPPLVLTMAVNAGRRGGGGVSEDGLVRLEFEAWGRTAEGMVGEAREGYRVWVYGKLATYSWVDKHGQDRCDVRVRMENAGSVPYTLVGKEEEEKEVVDWWGGWLGRVPQKKEQSMREVECLDVEVVSEQQEQQEQQQGSRQEENQLEMEDQEEEEEEKEEQQDNISSKNSKVRTFLSQLLRRRFSWRRKDKGNGGGISSWLK